MQIGGYLASEKKDFTLVNLKADFEPGRTTLSSRIKDDHKKLYLTTTYGGISSESPFTFAADDEVENLAYTCTNDGCGPSKQNHRVIDHSSSCKREHNKKRINIKKKCFTFGELVKELDISRLFGNAYYVVSDIKSELNKDKRVKNSKDANNPRLPCGLAQSTARSLNFGLGKIYDWHQVKRSLRLLRIFDTTNKLVKVFFIYEESPEKDKKRVFIPFRNNEAQTNIENDAESLVESVSQANTANAESSVEPANIENDAAPPPAPAPAPAPGNGGRRRSSRKYKKRTRRIKSKSSKKRSYTTKYSRFRRYRK
jgi:hypothetical protein